MADPRVAALVVYMHRVAARWTDFNRAHDGRFRFVYTPLSSSKVADHKGRFAPTGLRADWPTLVDMLVRDFGWLLEPIA